MICKICKKCEDVLHCAYRIQAKGTPIKTCVFFKKKRCVTASEAMDMLLSKKENNRSYEDGVMDMFNLLKQEGG